MAEWGRCWTVRQSVEDSDPVMCIHLAFLFFFYSFYTNVVLRFTPFEPSYLYPYLARRLSSRRQTLQDGILKQLESAPLVKY
ncbi:hypothetical protein Y032_0097g3034 [Ancylostoma ceylanicum]|uniref:Uncharacterized protein n=1 Tax=Ancylostoma ceylanicum TaxID=53326 RepID=A0A016TJS9_9BILA|nr:hypothetical protein Y032_0097g3034 [Ancylostoma ceylanicum]